jgi:hypothetical protein
MAGWKERRAGWLASLAFGVLATTGTAAQAATPPERCLQAGPELQAELVVRHGVFLRDASDRCDSLSHGTKDLWVQFNKTYGPLLARETARRDRTFRRLFRKDAPNAILYFDGRMVTSSRNVPVTPPFCENIKKILTQNMRGGWGSFLRQAKLDKDPIRRDYKVCD